MGPIQVVVQDGNNLVLEVTPTPNTTIILDRGIAGPMGDGDVDGPASSTDNALARFDGTTGKLIQNSVGILSDAGALTGLTAVDTTALDATNINALDGTASFSIANTTGVMTINDTKFTLQDNADNTKKAIFELSGITTATTRTYTLPNLTGSLATIGSLTQTFSGSTTFSSTFTLSSTTNTISLGASQTTGVLTMGGTAGTGILTLGRSTVSQQTDIQAGATASGSTKTINFGTGGLSGSITSINIGPQSDGATYVNIGSSTSTSETTIRGTLFGAAATFDNVTLSQLSIFTPYGFSNYLPNTNFTLSYSGISKSIGTEETAPTGLFFKPDGTKMYVSGSSGDDVNEYALSIPFDVSTATFTALFSVAGQDTAPADIYFKPDGLAFYLVGDTSNAVFQYTLSTAWDITTSSYASKTFSVAGQETSPSGIWFKPDGTEMYVVGSSTDSVYKYNLSTAWDVSTASYASVSFSVAAQDSVPAGLSFSSDGSYMYVLGSTGDEIYEYALSTAWDITTASFTTSSYVGFQEITPTAMYFNSSNVWVVGSVTDTVYQYNRNSIAIQQTNDNLLLTGYTRIQNNAYIDGSVKIDGSVTADGNLVLGGSFTGGNITANQITTSTSAITLGGATSTGNTTITAGQTSGLITIGGSSATSTGAITLGQSPATQTLNLATGATVGGGSPATKTVNIGTAGVSGSTTNINIGSAVSGALGVTALNQQIVVYQPAPASISTTATLTNANIQGQIINTTGTSYTVTMPLGTTLETLVAWAAVDLGYNFTIINTASGTITMAVNTGVTSLGGLTIATGISAQFRIRRTVANTFILYRLS